MKHVKRTLRVSLCTLMMLVLLGAWEGFGPWIFSLVSLNFWVTYSTGLVVLAGRIIDPSICPTCGQVLPEKNEIQPMRHLSDSAETD